MSTKVKLYNTFCVLMGHIVVGQNFGVLGPTLVHLEYVLNTTTQGMGLSFSADNFGGLIGAILCGMYFDRYNRQFQFTACFLWVAVFITIAPWTSNVYWFCLMLAVKSVGLGYFNAAGKTYILQIWIGHKYKDAFFQAVNAAWCIGSFTIPLMILPFLSELPGHNDSNNHLNNHKAEHASKRQKVTNSDFDSIYSVRYAYAIVGSFALLTSAMFCMSPSMKTQKQKFFNLEIDTNHKKQSEDISLNHKMDSTHRRIAIRTSTFLKALCCMYTGFVVCQGFGLGSFLSAFVIKGLNWPVQKGPMITSVFRGAQGIGRMLGVAVSIVLSPTKILTINMTLAIFSYFTMYSSVVYNSESLTWTSAAMAGFAISNSFSTTILWGAQYLKVGASYGSMFIIAACCAAMAAASLEGYLFDNYSPISVIYFVAAAGCANVIIFTLMNITVKFYTYYT